MSKRPPIERVFWSGTLGQCAIARVGGGIEWAEPWREQTGILLWESREDCAAWQIARAGRPVVVCEIGRADIATALLERVRDPDLSRLSRDRMWIYPDAITFTHVRWWTYREDVMEPEQRYIVIIPEVQRAPEGPPPGTGNIVLST